MGRERANLQNFFSYCPESYTLEVEALGEHTTEFLQKSSVTALKVNADETASTDLFYPMAAIKPYQKQMLKTSPLTTLPLDFFWHYSIVKSVGGVRHFTNGSHHGYNHTSTDSVHYQPPSSDVPGLCFMCLANTSRSPSPQSRSLIKY